MKLISQDAGTQTDECVSRYVPALGDGLDSLGLYLQQEQSLAKARAHKRLLLFRLLREFRASHSLEITVTRSRQQASTGSQTDLPGQSSRTVLESEGAEGWSPFVSAAQEPFADSLPLARAQSFPAADSTQAARATQQLQPAASAPHPIDDIIGVIQHKSHDAPGVVPALLHEAYASASSGAESPVDILNSTQASLCQLQSPRHLLMLVQSGLSIGHQAVEWQGRFQERSDLGQQEVGDVV